MMADVAFNVPSAIFILIQEAFLSSIGQSKDV